MKNIKRTTLALALSAGLLAPVAALAMRVDVIENIRATGVPFGGYFVSEKNGVVTLQGNVQSRFDRHLIVQAAKNTPGVTKVYNHLSVSN